MPENVQPPDVNAVAGSVELDLCREQLAAAVNKLENMKRRNAEALARLRNCRQRYAETAAKMEQFKARRSETMEKLKMSETQMPLEPLKEQEQSNDEQSN